LQDNGAIDSRAGDSYKSVFSADPFCI